ncbi:MAG: Crp/Fnr family transcriptional regulator [Chloroflexi bacterium]|jgi:CRP/FNR family transcriptional regulator/CRP/FNR family cyclic AMP-dependent transcriptional regulator|nr:Crp/Fnr family transcriptional regulator [Chloroflexota bacterium]MBK6709474.1 Crp/Fnr family transcriptional regulator [Chloroflexota bacterium]MBK7178610.1 Crp/Fnr family transcriptional regulator [Chloroflexota bacterium]MBK7915245.1 Crp/Fnr family transcriptional regulator [Chloroflexota bacterium]MBK8935568.1 Crp/Fnr family transcriptional regulator [Chloroflexota bacterium]
MNQSESWQTTPLFRNLTQAELAHITQDMIERHYLPGEIIFHEGDAGQLFYLVKSGQVRIFVNGLDGSETSVILMGSPGQMFGELAVIDGLPRSATAVAMHHTTLYTLTREAFSAHIRAIPQFSLNFLQELSTRLRYNTRQMDSLASLGVPQRLARKLLELAQNYGQARADGVTIHITLTQTDLASLIGATRESTNKSLRDFRQQQWIRVSQGVITLLDPEALRTQVAG